MAIDVPYLVCYLIGVGGLMLFWAVFTFPFALLSLVDVHLLFVLGKQYKRERLKVSPWHGRFPSGVVSP